MTPCGPKNLEDQVAVVTGGGGVLGAAIAEGLAAQGAQVVVQDLKASAAEATAERVLSRGGRAMSVTGDVRLGAVGVEQAVAEFGRLDILVNNAGVMNTTPFLELTQDEWDAVVDINLKGYFLAGQRAARVMVAQRYGRIVNVSSSRQSQAWPGNSAYCAAKGGVAMLTRAMALELAPYGVRVNSIAPGTIPSGLNKEYVEDAAFRAERIARIPAGRLGTPTDVVAAVLLLVSPSADFLVGASIAVDGGQTLW